MTEKPVIYQHPELDGKDFLLSGSTDKDIGFLFIHGFTATTVEVRQIANHFHSLGYTVTGPLLPGHGTSPEDMNKQSLSDWLDCVENAYQRLKKREITDLCFW